MDSSARIGPRDRRPYPDWLGYVAVAVAIGAATLLRLALDPLFGDNYVYTTYFLAAVLVAGIAQTREAILTFVGGGLVAVCLFAPPRYSFPITDLKVLLGLSIYLALAMAIVVMSHTMRVARQRVERLLTDAAEQGERLRTTLASIGDAVITTDTAARVTNLNIAAEALTGWTNADGMGKPLTAVFNVVNEATRQPVENPAIKALRDGVVVSLANHTVLIAKDGTERPIDDSGAPIRNKEGEVVGCVLVFRDITTRKQAEETIHASEARNSFLVTLADTIRPLSDPIAVQAEASRLLGERLGANRVVYFEARGDEYVVGQDYAVGVPSVVGRHTIAAFGPDQLAIYRAGRTAVEADVNALPFRPDSEKKAFAGVQIRSYIGVPLVKNGELVAGLAVHADKVRIWTPTEIAMTEDTAERTWAAVERVRAEDEVARLAAIAERERRLFAAVLSSTPDFIYTFDLNGRFVYINAALLALWGKRRDEAVGRDFFELGYPPALAERFQRQIRQVIETKQPVRDDTPYTSRLGERMYEYIFVPVVGADGTVEAVAGSTRDITDRKRAEEELRRLATDLSDADRRKDEFLATLAHELRNPLAPIRSGLQILNLAGANGTNEQTRSMMDRQLAQLVRLVDDLLDVSRITRGKLELRIERLELRGIIDAAVETSRPLIELAAHHFDVVVPDEPIFVDADATRLAQVVSNLLTNSAKYTHRGGHIRLTVRRNEGTVEVSVADNGIGIPRAMLDRVFAMFVQVDRSLEKTTGGLGIGLSLVKGLVEMHGGSVKGKSEGEGRGSEFVVTLPVAATVADGASEAKVGVKEEAVKEVESPQVRSVLVVDDNVDAANSLADLLEMLEFKVCTAYDGEAAVEAAAAFRPDLIFLDLGMPKLNGYEACRQIRKQQPGKTIVIVALTGWGQDEDRRKTAEAGFDHHLVKPLDLKALMKLLAGLKMTTQ